ncbi:MAG: cell division protein FtsW [Patescibacteria group bacterium]|nr:cell division protein FtsW [Patescibacteria group bacterium]MDE2172909.1 cell division protein FtsW [Patescibacteria group bacterium]
MSSRSQHIDRFFLISVGILTVFGFVIFLSASLGLLAQGGGTFGTVAIKQTISLIIGIAVFYVFSKIDYVWLRKYALIILGAAILINLLLFIPSLALHVNGASRWINVGLLSFQPSELLKVALIIYVAAWAYYAKDRVRTVRYGLLPYAAITGILSVLLLTQRDTDTLVIIAATTLVMFIIAGMRIRHVLVALALLSAIVGGVILVRPYALERVTTFLDRGSDAQGAGYQINQSLIAIGSGRIFGRGFGQSIQKFGYLPQPTDDSIFAVGAEEFGFVGSVGLLIIYVLLAASIFRIGTKSPDIFGSLLVIGIGILIITESFMNMAAMLGILPLSGVPLLFVSHGGTALVITLMTAGIVANVSKHSTL